MTKHLHMRRPSANPSGHERPSSENHRPLPAWFVFVALVLYAATVGFGGASAGPASFIDIASKLSDLWTQSLTATPRVLVPLRERGRSVLLGEHKQPGWAPMNGNDAKSRSWKKAAEPQDAQETP